MNPLSFSLPLFSLMVLIFFQGCGFKTPPEPLPEQELPRYFSEPQIKYKDSRLRIQWKIHDAAKVFFPDPSIVINGSTFLHEDSFKNTHAFFRDSDPGLLMEEFHGLQNCPDCDKGWFKKEFIPFTSTRFIRESSHLFLYDSGITEMQSPKMRQIRLSWLDDSGDLLQQSVIMGIPPRPVFPEAVLLNVEHLPELAENFHDDFDGDQEEFVEFGNVLRKLKGKDLEIKENGIGSSKTKWRQEVDETEQLLKGLENMDASVSYRRFSFRFSWPLFQESFYQRFPQPGEIIHKTRHYGANLYLLMEDGNIPETPMNAVPLREDHCLFQRDIKVSIPGPPIYETDTHPGVVTKQAWFYIDLESEKEDILVFKIRLVDRLGNEGPSSPPASIFLPRLRIAEQIWSTKGISPFSF